MSVYFDHTIMLLIKKCLCKEKEKEMKWNCERKVNLNIKMTRRILTDFLSSRTENFFQKDQKNGEYWNRDRIITPFEKTNALTFVR